MGGTAEAMNQSIHLEWSRSYSRSQITWSSPCGLWSDLSLSYLWVQPSVCPC